MNARFASVPATHLLHALADDVGAPPVEPQQVLHLGRLHLRPLPRPLPRPLLRPLQVVVAHGPGEDGVAGDHQVVDGEGDQGAVVGGDTRRAQDLFSKGVNEISR